MFESPEASRGGRGEPRARLAGRHRRLKTTGASPSETRTEATGGGHIGMEGGWPGLTPERLRDSGRAKAAVSRAGMGVGTPETEGGAWPGTWGDGVEGTQGRFQPRGDGGKWSTRVTGGEKAGFERRPIGSGQPASPRPHRTPAGPLASAEARARPPA